MNNANTLVDIGLLYEKTVTKNTPYRPAYTFKKEENKKVVDAKADPKAFIKNTGPEAAQNFDKEALVDPEHDTKGENHFQPKKYSQNLEKTEVKSINNSMNNKSIFDKLYEEVLGGEPTAHDDMADAEALDINVGKEEEGGDVTFTLPRDVAQQLCDVLHSALGSGEEDKEDEVSREATEMTELKPSAGETLMKKDNKVHGTVSNLVSKGHGDGKVTDKVGNDGNLADSKGKTLAGKNNKVAGKASNVGQYIYQK
ncbi:hypothetical protein EBR43_06985 [bacterium]|nr:hypothetical protein [bacterium]